MDESPLPPYAKGLTTASLQRAYVDSLQEEARMKAIWQAMGWSPNIPAECSASIKAGMIVRFHHVRERVTADRAAARVAANRRREAVRRSSMRCSITGEDCITRADKCDCPACTEWLGVKTDSQTT